MSTQIQWRKGTTAQTSTFTGALAEVTVDTDKKTLVVHDGSTAGGFPTAKEGNVPVDTHAASSKATPVDADEIPVADSASSFSLKKLTWANLKATLKVYFDTLYLPVSTVVPAETAWTDYSATSTIVGWSSFTTKQIYYKDIGKTRFVTFLLYGTSNSVNVSFTLPNASSNTINTDVPIRAIDSGAEVAVGLAVLAANSAQVDCYKSTLANWTGSGQKLVAGQLTYQLP